MPGDVKIKMAAKLFKKIKSTARINNQSVDEFVSEALEAKLKKDTKYIRVKKQQIKILNGAEEK